MKPARGAIARRIIFAYSSLTLVTLLVSAGSIAGIRFAHRKAIVEARQQLEMALLSGQIRSETLLLTNAIQRYAVDPESRKKERAEIETQINLLENLLQQAIDKIDRGNVDESIAIGLVRQHLVSFNVQSRRVLDSSDAETGFGPETKRQMSLLLEHYQSELIKSLENFEKFERDAAERSYAHADAYTAQIAVFLTLLSFTAFIFSVSMSVWLARRFVKPLTLLTENVKLHPEESLNTPIEIATDDEMGTLARALNQMKMEINESRHKLELHAATLESRVKERTRELKLLAITDPLTGVFNRGHFFALAEKILAESKRRKSPFSIAIFDIDHFKNVNDQLGHAAGDFALKQATRAMHSQIRQMDVLGRYGGEEFVLALPTANTDEALQIGARIVAAIREMQLEHEGHPFRITISGGVASYIEDNESLGIILIKADKALYQAKQNGRDMIVAYDPATEHKENA